MKQTAIKAAKEAGKILVANFSRIKKIKKKAPGDYVTNIDLMAEKKIINIIKKRFPSHSILSEEVGFIDNKSDFIWYIDPLDGTHNYIHNFPLFGVSIAVAHKGELQAGVIYLPMLKELYVAQRGKGAFLNGKKIKVSERLIQHSMVGFGAVLRRKNEEKLAILKKLAGNILDIRIFGVAVYTATLVAKGNLDAHVAVTSLPWDIAAGALIIQEAGGRITEVDGSPFSLESDNFVSSNGLVHKDILKIINQ